MTEEEIPEDGMASSPFGWTRLGPCVVCLMLARGRAVDAAKLTEDSTDDEILAALEPELAQVRQAVVEAIGGVQGATVGGPFKVCLVHVQGIRVTRASGLALPNNGVQLPPGWNGGNG